MLATKASRLVESFYGFNKKIYIFFQFFLSQVNLSAAVSNLFFDPGSDHLSHLSWHLHTREVKGRRNMTQSLFFFFPITSCIALSLHSPRALLKEIIRRLGTSVMDTSNRVVVAKLFPFTGATFSQNSFTINNFISLKSDNDYC